MVCADGGSAWRVYERRASIALGVSRKWEMKASIKMPGLVMSPKGQMKPTEGSKKGRHTTAQ